MDEFFNDYLQSVLTRAKEIENATLLVKAYMQGAADARAAQEKGNAFTAPTSTDSTKEQKIRGSYILPERKASTWSVLTFTEKEILRMPKKFRRDFRVGKVVAHVRQRENGVYEIRCQINKKKFEVSSKLLETAKEKFTALLKAEPVVPVPSLPAPPEQPPITLREYMLKYIETVKKPTVKEKTYKQYFVYVNCICPVLGDKAVKDIKPFEVQEFLNSLVADGKFSMAKNCKILLKAIFNYAVVDDIITKSPMLKIGLQHYEPEEGVPLTREEEKGLVERLKNGGDVYVQAYVFMLYTGLRRSELASIEIKDGWVNVISAKGRKGYKVKTRSIPISPMLAPLLPFINIEYVKNVNLNTLSHYVKNYIPPHHTHELRHTFITRCQECGCRREIVSLWAGHAADSSVTTAVYTHLNTNKDIQLEEIKKVDYKL